MKKTYGTLAVLLSAVLFGATPILARLSYNGGNNAISMTFYRALLALPVLFFMLRGRGVSLKLTKNESLHVVLVGLLGSVSTTLCLYGAYSYIPVGMATTLHFAYPMLVALAGRVLFGQRLGARKLVALCAGFLGVLLFTESGKAETVGVVLALISAVTFTYKVVAMGRRPLRAMPALKISFYMCAVEGVASGLIGLFTGQLAVQMTSLAWLYTFLVAILVSVVAVPLLKFGITKVGPLVAAVLSTVEPITSVVCGLLFLHESLSGAKLAGCALVLAGVLCVSFGKKEEAPA